MYQRVFCLNTTNLWTSYWKCFVIDWIIRKLWRFNTFKWLNGDQIYIFIEHNHLIFFVRKQSVTSIIIKVHELWHLNPLNSTILKIDHQKLFCCFFFCFSIPRSFIRKAWNEDQVVTHEHIKIINEIIRIMKKICAPCFGEDYEICEREEFSRERVPFGFWVWLGIVLEFSIKGKIKKLKID